MRTRTLRGKRTGTLLAFTLIEMMITLAVVSIAAGIALFFTQEILAQARARDAAQRFVGDMRRVRAESIREGLYFRVTSSASGTGTQVRFQKLQPVGTATATPCENYASNAVAQPPQDEYKQYNDLNMAMVNQLPLVPVALTHACFDPNGRPAEDDLTDVMSVRIDITSSTVTSFAPTDVNVWAIGSIDSAYDVGTREGYAETGAHFVGGDMSFPPYYVGAMYTTTTDADPEPIPVISPTSTCLNLGTACATASQCCSAYCAVNCSTPPPPTPPSCGGCGCGCGCFLADTMIQTPEGEKTIAELRVGDRVLASADGNLYDAAQATAALPSGGYQVTSTSAETVDELLLLQVDGEVIETTRVHPFFVDGVGFVAAGQLAVGDYLVGMNGTPHRVDQLDRLYGSFEVHNIEVAGAHTFFVSDHDLLVHNGLHPPVVDWTGVPSRVAHMLK